MELIVLPDDGAQVIRTGHSFRGEVAIAPLGCEGYLVLDASAAIFWYLDGRGQTILREGLPFPGLSARATRVALRRRSASDYLITWLERGRAWVAWFEPGSGMSYVLPLRATPPPVAPEVLSVGRGVAGEIPLVLGRAEEGAWVWQILLAGASGDLASSPPLRSPSRRKVDLVRIHDEHIIVSLSHPAREQLSRERLCLSRRELQLVQHLRFDPTFPIPT